MNKLSKKLKLTIAKTMIAFSFVLMSLGLYIHFDEQNYFIHPINDTKLVNEQESKEEKISINTIDNSTNTLSNDNIQIEENSEQNNATSDNKTNTETNSNTNSNITTNNTSNQETTNQNQQTLSLDVLNNNVRNSIQTTYGITVKYGAEVGNYSVGGLSIIQLDDVNVISQILSQLNYNLSLYPTNFFREIKSSGLTLTIYLIKKYSQDNVTGVTDSTYSNVIMSLATDYSFAESLNHELLHYIDSYIYKKGGNYLTWNNLNPADFIYGNVISSYSYNRTGSADAFFVNNYAQTDEYEDRASTFEYMMASSKASCLNYNKPVWLKAKYMAEQIDLFFNTVSPNVVEYWERYIY